MNEHIERLAEAVIDRKKDAPEYGTGWLMTDDELEAFAKAVARECAEIADAADKSTHPADLADAIRARYGVEG